MEIGLLLVRVVVGALLVGHGAQKLFGSFGGYGIAGTGGWFESIGFRPGRAMAVVAGLSELVGGLLLVLGLLTPLASAAIVGTMVVAASTHAASGLWNAGGGYELPLVLAVVGATVGLTGPGAYSLDAVLGCTEPALQALLNQGGTWAIRQIQSIDGYRLHFEPN